MCIQVECEILVIWTRLIFVLIRKICVVLNGSISIVRVTSWYLAFLFKNLKFSGSKLFSKIDLYNFLRNSRTNTLVSEVCNS